MYLYRTVIAIVCCNLKWHVQCAVQFLTFIALFLSHLASTQLGNAMPEEKYKSRVRKIRFMLLSH